MNYYRLYSLDNMDSHIVDVRDFRADGDDAAIVKVGGPVSGVSRELWNLGRKVMDFTQQSPSSADSLALASIQAQIMPGGACCPKAAQRSTREHRAAPNLHTFAREIPRRAKGKNGDNIS